MLGFNSPEITDGQIAGAAQTGILTMIATAPKAFCAKKQLIVRRFSGGKERLLFITVFISEGHTSAIEFSIAPPVTRLLPEFEIYDSSLIFLLQKAEIIPEKSIIGRTVSDNIHRQQIGI